MKKYNLIILIGRFQPFHVIHLQLVRHALELGERVLIILGSAKNRRTSKNLFRR